jgi:diacylglycerol kinase family enzyme
VNLPRTPMESAPSWRPVDPPRRPVLFVNPKSGGGKAARAGLAERARELGVEAVILDPGQDLAALARGAAAGGADALGMAGGDGSLAVVAAVAAAHGIAFACVPAGTRNHFALDVGVDRHDLTGALDAFTDGVERQIDVAEVNGRMFLNNVSLGIYGQAVRRAAYRDAKVRTLLATAEEVLGPSGEAPALRLADDAGREHRDPAVVLVSNNPYALDNPLAPGTRPALDTGRLGIVVLGVPGDTSLRPGQAWTAPRLEVSAPAAVHAGVDGEAVDLSPPLRFAIRPAALRVRISSRHPGASPSARLHLPGPPPPPRGSQDQLYDQLCDRLSTLTSYSRKG